MNATGSLVVGHGTRSADGTRQFLELVESVAQRLAPRAVQPAFLELQQPAIDAGLQRLASAGVEHVVVVPLLLFSAGHARRDIPAAMAAALARHRMTAVQTDVLGCERQLLELSHRRYLECGDSAPLLDFGSGDAASKDPKAAPGHRTPNPKDCLLLVGRGSRDQAATAEMHEFARQRQLQEGGIATEVAFLAMARPSLAEQLPRIAAAGYRRVIVQPHLLFDGELSAGLAGQVAEVSAQRSRTQWLVTRVLADLAGKRGAGTQALADVICERLARTTIRVVAPAGDH